MEASIIISCLILSAFFSGMEIAFISSNKVYLGIEKMQDTFLSRILSRLTEKPSQFIAAMLIGNNIALVVYGFFMSNMLMRWFDSSGFGISTAVAILLQIIITALIIIITSEFLPKVFFQIYANSLIKIFALPAYFFYNLFYYIATGIISVSDFILRRVFHTAGDQKQLFFSKTELGNYITEQMNAVENLETVDSEIQIFQNALEFSTVKARDIMNPRTEIASVDIHDDIAELKALFVQTGYSKILVCQNSLDDILGYVHSFELFRKPASIASVIIPVEFIPETMLIKDAMNLLTKKRKSVAIVIDEYGGTSGMITIEDIVEELFGEIEDEHDEHENFTEEALEPGVFLFSARLDVEYINETYQLDIPESDSYSTLGGFIVDHTSEIPLEGDNIQIANFHFVIHAATNKKIELVKMRIGD